MSTSKLSTKSASKNALIKKDFVISNEFISGKSDLSLDLSSSLISKDLQSFQELGNKELNLIAGLEDLDASLIPNDSKSVSMLNDLHNEEQKLSVLDETYKKRQGLLMENSQIRQRLWCVQCLPSNEGPRVMCTII